MKNTIKHFLVLALLSTVAFSCSLSRSAVVKGTVKDLVSTTCDYYDFYHPSFGEGVLKDCSGTISRFKSNPDLPIRIIPAEVKSDIGYFYIKKAGYNSSQSTTLDPNTPSDTNELVLLQRDFELKKFAQRGN